MKSSKNMRNWKVVLDPVNLDVWAWIMVVAGLLLVGCFVYLFANTARYDSPSTEEQILIEVQHISRQLHQTCIMVAQAIEESPANCETPPHLRRLNGIQP